MFMIGTEHQLLNANVFHKYLLMIRAAQTLNLKKFNPQIVASLLLRETEVVRYFK